MAIPYRVRPLTQEEGEQIARWRYPAPYNFYDSAPMDASPELLAATVAYYLDPVHAYCAVDDESGAFLGFGCFGVEAQVPGYAYTQSLALDIGFGMRPERIGGGRGQPFLAALLAHAVQVYRPGIFRASVAAFNQRSARTFLRADFRQCASFRSQTAHPTDFYLYTRDAA